MRLQEQAKKLPLASGVYIFKSKSGEILYVGRATSLCRRVAQYFRSDVDGRIGEMVSMSTKIVHHKTDTVLDAIVLEANLIKKYWPKYNVKDRDDRSFAYIVIPKVSFSRPFIARGRELKKFPPSSANIFGPYSGFTIVKNALKIIRRVFPYGTCRPLSGKPCFEYQIGACPGACVGAISQEDYGKNIRNLVLFLKGEKRKLLRKLAKENPAAALALRHIQDVTLVTREEFEGSEGARRSAGYRLEGYDISHFAGKETYGSMVVFLDGRPEKSQYRLFKIKGAPANNDLEALKEMVDRRLKHAEWPRPDLILIDGGRPQVDYIYRLLRQREINIPMLGISKLHGDKLVFPPGVRAGVKSLAEAMREVLLKTRDEAHRFAIKAHRRSRERI